MTTSVYAPAGTISDVYGRDDAAVGGVTIPSPQILAAGFDDVGKSGTAGYNSFLRFEIDIPDDAIIEGFALRLVTSQQHQVTTWDFRFGLIDPNHAKSDGLWTNSDGFHQSNYPTMFDLPHPTSEKGAEPPTNDVTVFFESTPAFTLVDWVPPAKDTDITMHEGTQTGVHSVSGFIAKLERYLADPTMTSFRDGGSGLLPICITIGWEPEALPLADYWQKMYSTDPGTPAGWEPQLTVDWRPLRTVYTPTVGELTEIDTGNTVYDQNYTCDRCGIECDRTEVKREFVNRTWSGWMMCPDCWDQDHPQLQLSDVEISDSRTLRDPRPDIDTGEDS
jgi:hypothetical protein